MPPPPFIEHFAPVLELIGSTVDVKFAEQVGLRYVDLIRPTADRPATDFLRENVRGLSRKDLGAKESRHQFVTQAQTEHGSLFVRSFDNTGPNVMPPDLASTKLDLQIDLDGLND